MAVDIPWGGCGRGGCCGCWLSCCMKVSMVLSDRQLGGAVREGGRAALRRGGQHLQQPRAALHRLKWGLDRWMGHCASRD